MTNDSYITSVQVCELLNKLADLHVKVPITLFLDNAAYQRCIVVRETAARLRELGVREHMVQMECELWILMQSVSPTDAVTWIADKCDATDDPEFCAIYLEHDAAIDLSADDPRLVVLADRSERWFANRPIKPDKPKGRESAVQEPVIIQLIATSFNGTSPAWDRLIEIIRQRKAGR